MSSKLTALTENTTPLSTDIAYMVDDPGGTPLQQKVTFASIKTLFASATEVLSNKALEDSTTTIVDEGDNTAGIAFQASGITTGNIRLWTAPDIDTDILPAIITASSMFVGLTSGEDLTSATNSTGVGKGALANLTSGGENTGIGTNALNLITTQTNNTAVGYTALGGGGSGVSLTAVGAFAGLNDFGLQSTYIGALSGPQVSGGSGSNNSTFGFESGRLLSSGTDNTLGGSKAGDNITTADRCLILGSDIDAMSATVDNQVNIQNLIYGTGASGTGITPAGNVGIGVIDPDTALEVLFAGNQLKLSFDGTDNTTFGVDTNGDITITPSGSTIINAGNSRVVNGTLTSTQAGTTYTFVLSDAGTNIRFTGANVILTVPTDASVTYQGATQMGIENPTATDITLVFTAGAGANLNPDSHLTVRAGGIALLVRDAADKWYFAGQTAA